MKKSAFLGGLIPDALPLSLMGIAGFLCYGGLGILKLGFYHDDWAVFSPMYFAKPGLIPHIGALCQKSSTLFFRPMEILIYGGMFTCFGIHPLPWQLALMGTNIAMAFLVYKLLSAFRIDRGMAFLGALLFLSYPSKDATMFWPIVIVNSVALLFFLAGFLSHCRYVETGSRRHLFAAGLGWLLSLMTYDQTFFLFFLCLVTPSYPDGKVSSRRKFNALLGALAIVGLYAVYKFLGVPYGLGIHYNKKLVFSASHAAFVYAEGLRSSLGPDLIGYVLKAAWKTVVRHPVLAMGAAILPWMSLALKASSGESEKNERSSLMILGIGIFMLGYLPIGLSDYWPMPFNHMNRINQVPVLGIVLAFVGACQALPGRFRMERVACAAASILLAAHAAFAGSWAESYRVQSHIRDLVKLHAAQWPEGVTLLLLMPRYIAQGKEYFVDDKAPIFIAHWDISGAAQIWTEDESRKADILTPRSRFLPAGIQTRPGAEILPYEAVRVLDADRDLFVSVSYRNFAGVP